MLQTTNLDPAQAKRILWLLSARDDQLPPTDDWWLAWWLRSGRGAGKTRTGAEWIAEQARTIPGSRWHVVAPTQGDCRDICFTGESGLIAVLDPSEIASFVKTELIITLTNGSKIKGFSAEKPDRLRGPQCHGGWLEEVSSWQNSIDTLDMFEFGNRLPRADHLPNRYIITSTPKRNKITKLLNQDPRVHITVASTYDNVENLNKQFFDRMREKYEGTRLGEQELHGRILEDQEGALWTFEWFTPPMPRREFTKVAVAWDPAVTSGPDSDEHGISAVGLVKRKPGELSTDAADFSKLLEQFKNNPEMPLSDLRKPVPCVAQVLEDLSIRTTPVIAAKRCITLAKKYGAKIVYIEDNQGKETWKSVWKEAGGDESGILLRRVSATKSKEERAIPVSMLFEQRKIEMSPPPEDTIQLDLLKDEMLTWVPTETKKSPNRIDACVWAFIGLGIGGPQHKGTHRSGRLSEL